MSAFAVTRNEALCLDADALDIAEEEAVNRAATSAPAQSWSATAPGAVSGGAAPMRSPRLTLSLLLRSLGGLVIVAAFVLYLFEGWRDSDDLSRSLLLLGHTLALTLAGLASGHWLRENKGARLFIALALAAVPVNFAFLGGLTYPFLSWDAPAGMAAAASIWTQSQGHLAMGPALLLSGASLLVLVLSVWLGFRVMARDSVAGLSGLYLLSNAALLIPTRSDAMISALLVGLALTLGLLGLQLRRRDPALATAEGRFARAVLLLPLLILGGRSLWLYAPDTLFVTTLSLLGYLALRFLLVSMAPGSAWRGLVEALAVAMAVMVTALAGASLLPAWSLAEVVYLPLSAAILGALLLDLSRLTGSRSCGYQSTAVMLMSLSLLLDLGIHGGFGLALVALLAGVAALGFGYVIKGRLLFATGLITALAALATLATEALEHFSLGGWSALVLLGIAIIIAGSALERHGERLKTGLSGWRAHFADAD
ncbi:MULTISPECIES: hypothetical protein [Thiorhodovibrio]|uniref:hypothetical protein n=1 Tax=Thiorhodovibrio TaxID=61593 RepID=UPI0019128872|nr:MULTISPECIES: hypothetical protein [Thiorhodovibrio]MBK5968473.1 hypothetical protein [Thiorhodovibrio winogradskyi]WPL11117.1 hypothetical protein Thiosp_00845 [Thiorhodovibrio litoralis]